MASTAASALSPDRKYWANLRDGRKLTIYDTSQNTFSVAEDFIQNSQESSFSSVLVWLSDATQLAGKNNAVSKTRGVLAIIFTISTIVSMYIDGK